MKYFIKCCQFSWNSILKYIMKLASKLVFHKFSERKISPSLLSKIFFWHHWRNKFIVPFWFWNKIMYQISSRFKFFRHYCVVTYWRKVCSVLFFFSFIFKLRIPPFIRFKALFSWMMQVRLDMLVHLSLIKRSHSRVPP